MRLPWAEKRLLARRSVSNSFDAFVCYSLASQSLAERQSAQAQEKLQEALNIDPSFGLAASTLKELQQDALCTLTDLDKQRLERAGRVGKALAEHLAHSEHTLLARSYDAAYFAALLTVSAHAGILNDREREKALLFRFWRDFTHNVPANQAVQFCSTVNPLVLEEGQFFRDQIDSGEPFTLSDFEDQSRLIYLKPELRDTLSWPRYAAMWPFENRLRINSLLNGTRGPAESFTNALPKYPHDYMSQIIEMQEKADITAACERVRLRSSIIRYYATATSVPDELSKGLLLLKTLFIQDLEAFHPQDFDVDVLAEVICGLNVMAKTNSHDQHQHKAATLLLDYSRQLDLISGTADPGAQIPDSASVTKICGIEVKGPRVAVVWRLDSRLIAMPDTPGFAAQQCLSMVRGLALDCLVNIYVFGDIPKGQKPFLFESLEKANHANKLRAVEYLDKLRASTFGKPVQASEVLARILSSWRKRPPVPYTV
jgi:hypothetical protein